MSGTLTGRAVVVTGGNRGIGLGLARGVAAAGASVAIWGRDKATLAEGASELAAMGVNAIDLVCDVSDEDAVKAAFAASVEALGPIHAAFANAGIGHSGIRFLDRTNDDWLEVMKVNLGGTVFLFRAALKHMLEHRQGGALVAVSSISAISGMFGNSPYAASKAATLSLVQTIAVEYARRGIRANALLPGWVQTDMTSATPLPLRKSATTRIPVGRFATPDDFSSVAAFLADPTQVYHTGQSVVLDGAYLNN